MVQKKKKARESASADREKRERIVRHLVSLPDGTHILEHLDGRLERRKGETDWERVKALTDKEIEASIKNDPDWSDDWNWSDAILVIPPRKTAISIRIDADVLDYFKKQGAGYQRRMNAVLRSYMEQKRKKRA